MKWKWTLTLNEVQIPTVRSNCSRDTQKKVFFKRYHLNGKFPSNHFRRDLYIYNEEYIHKSATEMWMYICSLCLRCWVSCTFFSGKISDHYSLWSIIKSWSQKQMLNCLQNP